ncbi:MAG: hypothetical protein ACYCO0_05160 [Candidatus Micrarchaeaceae archaeon]
MPGLKGICHVCGKVAERACRMCGRASCEMHLKNGICRSCLSGKG